eukprot:362385-Chlamydomonas_euryale.AAC.1
MGLEGNGRVPGLGGLGSKPPVGVMVAVCVCGLSVAATKVILHVPFSTRGFAQSAGWLVAWKDGWMVDMEHSRRVCGALLKQIPHTGSAGELVEEVNVGLGCACSTQV